MVGLDERGVDGIRAINEHWDGGGIPDGIADEQIPLLARSSASPRPWRSS